MKKKEIVIGMIWHSLSSHNLGVGALTLSHLQLISKQSYQLNIIPKYILIGTKCDEILYPESFQNSIIDYETVTRRKLVDPTSRLHSLIKKCDLVFDIGEGDSFSDIYGGNRFFRHVFTKILCVGYKVPYILAPQTIGPYKRLISRWIAKQVMLHAKKIFCRDRLSQDYVEKMGVTNTVLVTDVAFALPFDGSKGNYTDGKFHIGFNVSGLLYHGGYSGNNMFDLRVNYPELIDRLLSHFIKRKRCTIHLVSHVAYPPDTKEENNVENDYSVCYALKEKYPEVVLEDISSSPIQAKSLISRFDYFVGSRMHACIAACSSGVPVIPIAYSRKFKGLFENLGYLHVADCCIESEDEIYEKVILGYESRESLAAELVSMNLQATQSLDKYCKDISHIIQSLL